MGDNPRLGGWRWVLRVHMGNDRNAVRDAFSGGAAMTNYGALYAQGPDTSTGWRRMRAGDWMAVYAASWDWVDSREAEVFRVEWFK